jgi:hypothetical protein
MNMRKEGIMRGDVIDLPGIRANRQAGFVSGKESYVELFP